MGFVVKEIFPKYPSDWQVKLIGEIVDINKSSISKNDDKEQMIRYVDIKSVDRGRLTEAREMKLADAPSRAKRKVKLGDTIISTVRPNLEHYYLFRDAITNEIVSTGYAVVSPNKELIDYKYLYYFLTTNIFTKFLTQTAEGHAGVYPSFKPSLISSSEILYPPIIEQKAIGKILSLLDQKIELNHQMNETLEQMAQAIFKSWFVDFEPFRDPEHEWYCEFEYNEELEKEIPKGWESTTIKDELTLNYGKGLTKKKRKGGNVPVYGSNGIVGYHNESIVEYQTIVIGRKGSVGELELTYHPSWPIDTTYYVESDRKEYIFYWYQQLKTLSLNEMNSHSAVPGLNRDQVYQLKIIKPKDDVINHVNSILNSFYSKIKINISQIETLTQLRDLLLPQLISGKLRIPDPEKFLEVLDT